VALLDKGSAADKYEPCSIPGGFFFATDFGSKQVFNFKCSRRIGFQKPCSVPSGIFFFSYGFRFQTNGQFHVFPSNRFSEPFEVPGGILFFSYGFRYQTRG